MKERIVLVDFAGTLIRPEVLDEANKYRSTLLKRALPTAKDHAHPKKLYRDNRKLVSKLTGLRDNALIQYRENDLESITLRGDLVQNQIATNLFQIGMYMAAKKFKKNIAPKGFAEQLRRIRDKGYKLAIVSGVREDIITGMIVISGLDVQFDYIYGQPPILGVSNEQNMGELRKKGNIEYAIGDKMSDLEAGKGAGAKTIFVRWGHPSGGEEEFADYSIDKPKQLEEII